MQEDNPVGVHLEDLQEVNGVNALQNSNTRVCAPHLPFIRPVEALMWKLNSDEDGILHLSHQEQA